MKNYIYVNWKKKEIVKTTSHSSQPKGKNLIQNGFELYGIFSGYQTGGLYVYNNKQDSYNETN